MGPLLLLIGAAWLFLPHHREEDMKGLRRAYYHGASRTRRRLRDNITTFKDAVRGRK